MSDDRREELARPAHLHDGSSQAEHPSEPPPATARAYSGGLKDVATSVRAILNHGNVPQNACIALLRVRGAYYLGGLTRPIIDNQ